MNRLLASLGFVALFALQSLPGAFAHGDEDESSHEHMSMDKPMNMGDMGQAPERPTYFLHDEHTTLILAHIVLMVLAWVVALPLGESSSFALVRWS